MRLVTFQSGEVTDDIISKGMAETLIPINGYFRRSRWHEEPDKFIRFADESVQCCRTCAVTSLYGEYKKEPKYQIVPFYAYKNHKICMNTYNLSARTIGRLASHFISYMEYDGRDILELDVPDNVILKTRSCDNYEECLLPHIKKEWVVSILRFDQYVTEFAYGELAAKYVNEVFNANTYHMCYSKDIVLSGHGYGDSIEFCLSPEILADVRDVSVQRDYVQSQVFSAFKKYLYMIRHGMSIQDIPRIDGRAASAEMPQTINKDVIGSFNICKDEIFRVCDVSVHPTNTTYKDRKKYVQAIRTDNGAKAYEQLSRQSLQECGCMPEGDTLHEINVF